MFNAGQWSIICYRITTETSTLFDSTYFKIILSAYKNKHAKCIYFFLFLYNKTFNFYCKTFSKITLLYNIII